MSSTMTLTDFQTKIGSLLMDVSHTIWDATYINSALLMILREYTRANPRMVETVITLPGDGREIAVDSDELIDITDVWWPYDSAATVETWPPNRVRGFRTWFDDGRAVLFLELDDGDQPKKGDEVRIFYSTIQYINGLWGSATTIPETDVDILITGAAGQAALSRSLDLAETAGTDLYAVTVLGVWGRQKLREFYTLLEDIRARSARRSVPWGAGWGLDKWD